MRCYGAYDVYRLSSPDNVILKARQAGWKDPGKGLLFMLAYGYKAPEVPNPARIQGLVCAIIAQSINKTSHIWLVLFMAIIHSLPDKVLHLCL